MSKGEEDQAETTQTVSKLSSLITERNNDSGVSQKGEAPSAKAREHGGVSGRWIAVEEAIAQVELLSARVGTNVLNLKTCIPSDAWSRMNVCKFESIENKQLLLEKARRTGTSVVAASPKNVSPIESLVQQEEKKSSSLPRLSDDALEVYLRQFEILHQLLYALCEVIAMLERVGARTDARDVSEHVKTDGDYTFSAVASAMNKELDRLYDVGNLASLDSDHSRMYALPMDGAGLHEASAQAKIASLAMLRATAHEARIDTKAIELLSDVRRYLTTFARFFHTVVRGGREEIVTV